ncbi:hypothetical protein EXU57_04045 [Segetibacter sp. 3557_3]|uniref:hypothetical protein n=1 Tax=Segetibacter sp. 3557_3 TaxID=2547429 RepID=UPI0010587BF7|nr:hypothetical protein [Segetibacter sp. 3557_3]TDH29246.1 hypothetical protein EXU57_04045 [Segetibacter sp. 3557_3]
MKRSLHLLLCMAIFANAAHSQQLEGIGATVMAGHQNARSSANHLLQLSPQGINGFTDNYRSVGIEGFYRKGRDVYATELTFNWQQRHHSGIQYAEPIFNSIRLKYGYIINNNSKVLIYPTFAAGATKFLLSTYSFENFKMLNLSEKSLAIPSFAIGISTDVLLSPFNHAERYYLGWIAGLKAGYNFSLQSKKWMMESSRIAGPPYATRGFYVSLAFGAGSFDFVNSGKNP